MAKDFDTLIQKSVDTIFNPQKETPTAEDQAQTEAQTDCEYIPLPRYKKFNLEEARAAVLSAAETEDVRNWLQKCWSEPRPTAHMGRKPVGKLTDYTRQTYIVSNRHNSQLDELCKAAGYTKKEGLEFVLELAFTVLTKNGVLKSN